MAARLSALQFFFAITWVVYVIYLPALAAQAGIDKRYVPAILMMDQAIFIACDWAAGAYADRLARVFGRVGGWMAGVSLVSCAAFLLMPFVAPFAGSAAFLVLVVVWSATSSALRAPPLVIASRYSPAEQRPWLSSFYLLGIGVATALAPFLGIALRGVDPRVPFVAASLGVALFAMIAAWAEPGSESPQETAAASDGRTSAAWIVLFAVVVLLFGIGLQLHVAVNSAPAYLRFVRQEALAQLTPVFWIGFNLAVLPAALLPKRLGGLRAIAAAGALGAAALYACTQVASLEALVAAQLVAGASWAVALSGAVTAAIETGRPDREGLVTGLLFSALAGAALARLFAVSAGLPSDPGLARASLYLWIGASLLAGALALRVRARQDASIASPKSDYRT